jgi:uncharacterized protein
MRFLAVLLLALLIPTRAHADPFDDARIARQHGDNTKAIEILKPLADGGDSMAQLILGDIYESKGVNQNYAEAVKWDRKAAEQGEKQAQYNLGQLYISGEGVQKDEAEGVKWILMAADQWHVPAIISLADMYSKGQGVKQDIAEAYFWSRISPTGHWALPKLAEQLTPDQITALNKKADDWRAARSPHAVTLLSAEECKHAPSDDEYRRTLAENGDPGAEFSLAFGSINGFSADALKWFRMAAENGHSMAQNIMGRVYASNIGGVGPYGRDGDMFFAKHEGLAPDYAEAAKWFRKAAEQGEGDGEYFLGLLLRDGLGVKQDYEEAYFWTSRGIRGYEDKFPGLLDEIRKHLTLEQIADVDKRVKEWKPVQVVSKNSRPSINIFGLLCGGTGAGASRACFIVDTCGDLVGIDCNSGGDGPFYFADKKTKEIVGSCSFWNGRCRPPALWTCGQPKHYRG